MAGLSINLDIDPGLKRLRETTPKAQRALARALNTSAITTRAEASRRIHAQGFRFKVSTIKDALKIKKASATGATLNVSIDARGYPNALIKFDVFPKPSPKGRGFAPCCGYMGNRSRQNVRRGQSVLCAYAEWSCGRVLASWSNKLTDQCCTRTCAS